MPSDTRPRGIPADLRTSQHLLELLADALADTPLDLSLPEPTSVNRASAMPSDFQLRRMAGFRRSVLCRDITQGLHSLLAKNRRGCAPEHGSILQRYHIVEINGRKPKLGMGMKWETCNQEPGVACYHGDLMCFDPNECAVRFMEDFCWGKDAFREASDECSQAQKVCDLYRDCIPSQYAKGWLKAVTNIFSALYTIGLTDNEWDPTVHGVLFRNCSWGFQMFANDLFQEIMVARAKRNMREFCSGRRLV